MATTIYFPSCDIDTVSPVAATSGLPRQSTFPLDYSTLKRSRSFTKRRQRPESQVSLTLSHWDSSEQAIKYGECP